MCRRETLLFKPDSADEFSATRPCTEARSSVIKVLLLIPTLDRSGAEKQFTLLATRLPKDEFEVHAATLTRGGPYEADLRDAGIPLTALNKRMKFDPAALFKLRKLVRKLKPDVLHTWLFAANAYGRMAVGKAATTRVLVGERCVDLWKSGWQLQIDRLLSSRATRLIGNSAAVAQFYRQQGFPDERIVVIPNGVDVAEPASVSRDAVLAEFDIPPGAKVVGFVGRLARQKRVNDLVWAMQLLRQLTDNVYFLVIGDGPERPRLMRLARQLTCDALTRFVGHRNDATRLIGLLDVFWLASDFEGMSNSVMEAMAAAVPVVVSDIPTNRELVVDGETGFFVKVGDSVGFAQFADRILAERDLAGRLGNAGRARLQAEFSVERMIESYVTLYRQVVSPDYS